MIRNSKGALSGANDNLQLPLYTSLFFNATKKTGVYFINTKWFNFNKPLDIAEGSHQ